jgi:hypothetical protein
MSAASQFPLCQAFVGVPLKNAELQRERVGRVRPYQPCKHASPHRSLASSDGSVAPAYHSVHKARTDAECERVTARYRRYIGLPHPSRFKPQSDHFLLALRLGWLHSHPLLPGCCVLRGCCPVGRAINLGQRHPVTEVKKVQSSTNCVLQLLQQLQASDFVQLVHHRISGGVGHSTVRYHPFRDRRAASNEMPARFCPGSAAETTKSGFWFIPGLGCL